MDRVYQKWYTSQMRTSNLAKEARDKIYLAGAVRFMRWMRSVRPEPSFGMGRDGKERLWGWVHAVLKPREGLQWLRSV